MSPYAQLLSIVVQRLRAAEFIGDPPAVPVFAEWEEPDEDYPGTGSDLTAQVDTALAKAGLAVIVYIDSVDVTEQSADLLDLRIQVVENIVNNRHETGTQKASINVTHACRSALENWQNTDHKEWSPLQFAGISTLSKGPIMIREARFNTQTLMSTAYTSQS